MLLAEESVELRHGAGGLVPMDLTEDAGQVSHGCVFLARKGARFDGRDFIACAIASGAVAVLTDEQGAQGLEFPLAVASDLQGVGARLAHAIHGAPSHAIDVVGVTGTNGKTTCTTLLHHLLQAADMNCGLLGGIDVYDGDTFQPATLTTPAAGDIARLLALMRAHGCQASAMEVSSQAIATDRIEGVKFAVQVFTNLSGDHLDLHGDMQTYATIKTQWMQACTGTAVVNIDDAVGRTIAQRCDAPLTCGVGGDVQVVVKHADLAGQRLGLTTPWGQAEVALPLLGAHNAMNAAQSLAAACLLGASFDTLCTALCSAPVPRGRLQAVDCDGTGPSVFVDFAHTDGALHAVLSAMRPLVQAGGQLIVVMGCGGDRDAAKRPRMAAVACDQADVVWCTSDNPRTEDPEAILNDVLRGVHDGAQVHRQVDRRTAIQCAIAQASHLDVVVIAGKGHERVQLIGEDSIEFDDVEVARSALATGIDA
jgi:UDP-N-acetylmuramoyl-L-alanyl-D-glutamate--2,6-diaminopimelate ligase